MNIIDVCTYDVVDLSDFKSLPSQLDLIVSPTEELEAAIVKDTDEISSSVDPLTKLLEAGESFFCELRPVEVAFADQPT